MQNPTEAYYVVSSTDTPLVNLNIVLNKINLTTNGKHSKLNSIKNNAQIWYKPC
jgi:hypothetical protein